MSLSLAQSLATVAGMLGERTVSARDVTSMAFNQVFEVQLASGESVYLKLASEEDLAREVAVLGLLREVGVPCPRVMATDFSPAAAHLPLAILSAVPGSPVDVGSAAMLDLGAVLRRIHDIEIPGYGLLWVCHEGLVGASTSWLESAYESVDRVEALRQAGLMPGVLARAVQASFHDHAKLLDWAGPGRLLHGDLHPRHVFAVDSSVVGIIDWADASSGDPFVDLGRLVQAGASDVDIDHGLAQARSALMAYGEADHLDDETDRRLLVYAAWRIVRSMTKGDLSRVTMTRWRSGQCNVLDAILKRLRAT